MQYLSSRQGSCEINACRRPFYPDSYKSMILLGIYIGRIPRKKHFVKRAHTGFVPSIWYAVFFQMEHGLLCFRPLVFYQESSFFLCTA